MDRMNLNNLLLNFRNHSFQRILILGCPGAGKTMLAIELSKALKIPLFHMDDLYWLPNWTRPMEQDFLNRLFETLDQAAWIIDGNYHQYLLPRLKKADAVILLDVGRFTCFWRVFKRSIFRIAGNYSTLPVLIRQTASNKFDLNTTVKLIKNIFTFPKKTIPRMVMSIEQMNLPLYVLDKNLNVNKG